MELVKNVGAIATSVMAVAALLGSVWWLVRKIVKITDAVQQLKPNGGSSLADKINQLGAAQKEQTKAIEKLQTDVENLKMFDDEISEAIIPKQRRRRR